MPPLLLILLTAMLPIAELRGAIPIGVTKELPPWSVLIASVIGNMAPVPFIVLFARKVLDWLGKRSGGLARRVRWLEERAQKKGAILDRYRLLGLFILVAIPLPGTGAWTGSLVAAMFDMRLKVAFPIIFLGVLAAGIVMCIVSYGFAALF